MGDSIRLDGELKWGPDMLGRAWSAHMFMVLVEEVPEHGDVLCDIDS